ncbi:23S rRNA (adenine(2503)-C(2))-methyltransferase RlmN [Rickettsiales endosymbiont of Stachyamoeba lipophora]|uniref:23S rRNA (adenine(2503)-C(2))-methyltransferase RlmN n=1 Tax=Rickettsiales endosymbiont of Stachyamoeba lipophora TaxID=2486578 RepID=UPI000F64E3B0|nr:23S rRNA (adenine(2503)-C(2))-methyltransferase RlmN [Rickettsiales endosymbiont of Stachyamoeba lipophora]AZL15508.1 23S rRNA (adenine(2503)-C(2))-methyltransferase RlmN [Rickettsiales endosymbiont of Stachyamoeba lipophora]
MTDVPKKQLIGLSREELNQEITSLGEPNFRAKQLWSWIYNFGETDFNKMHNLGKKLVAQLEADYTIARPKIVKDLQSFDGTRKWLIDYATNQEAETVYIPEVDRGTLCVSSQVGCTLNCTFCHTGTQKLARNLTSYDIVTQMMIARDALNEWPSTQETRLVSNIVMMGMGEPLYNYDNIIQALKIIMDGEGIALSRRRITLSTSGVVPKIEQLGQELAVNLAISLHAVTNELRDEIVPLNRKYPIEELLEACRKYPAASNTRRITFEYVMLKGINDSIADAKELVRLIKGIPAKVNLIPFNPWPGTIYECSAWNQIKTFAEVIENAGYASPIRTPRGRDILAACGQLRSESTPVSKSILKKNSNENAN